MTGSTALFLALKFGKIQHHLVGLRAKSKTVVEELFYDGPHYDVESVSLAKVQQERFKFHRPDPDAWFWVVTAPVPEYQSPLDEATKAVLGKLAGKTFERLPNMGTEDGSVEKKLLALCDLGYPRWEIHGSEFGHVCLIFRDNSERWYLCGMGLSIEGAIDEALFAARAEANESK